MPPQEQLPNRSGARGTKDVDLLRAGGWKRRGFLLQLIYHSRTAGMAGVSKGKPQHFSK